MSDTGGLGVIDHFVVLMLENRSFDHMLGLLYADRTSPSGQSFDGLTGGESNPDASGKPVEIFQISDSLSDPYFMPGADPGEGYDATNAQLFGAETAPSPPVATNTGFVTDFAEALRSDPKSEIKPGTTPSDIMGVFTPSMLPVLSGLARGFAVCDRWFCSVPTETLPNRAFVAAATSQGHMSDATKSFTCPSVYGLMSGHGVSWRIFGYTSDPLTRLDFPDTMKAPDANFGLFTDFQAAAHNGALPAYSFLEPDFSPSGNDEHPPYDVARGEAFVLAVYQALRAGPSWNSTLLIVTYDEHGGCYDHVAPPTNAVAPDASVGEDGFDFKRFGVRVPTVLVSPWISPGTVFRPSGATPLDHTSIPATLERRFGLPSLTARDAAAPDVGAAITESAPRTDDPMAAVVPPPASAARPSSRPSHLQRVHAELAGALPLPGRRASPEDQLAGLHDATDYQRFIDEKVSAWKRSRPSTS